MKNILPRIVSILLAASLLADSSLATVLPPQHPTAGLHFDFLTFNEQALAERAESVTAVDSPMSARVRSMADIAAHPSRTKNSAMSPDEIRKNIEKATVGVWTLGAAHRSVQYGSGVGVLIGEDESDWYFLTNRHVVKSLRLISIWIPGAQKSIPARRIDSNDDGYPNDLALLKVEKSFIPLATSLDKAKLAPSHYGPWIETRQTVFVSSLDYRRTIVPEPEDRTWNETKRGVLLSGTFLIDLPFWKGASGSPVVDEQGYVIGLIRASNSVAGEVVSLRAVHNFLELYKVPGLKIAPSAADSPQTSGPSSAGENVARVLPGMLSDNRSDQKSIAHDLWGIARTYEHYLPMTLSRLVRTLGQHRNVVDILSAKFRAWLQHAEKDLGEHYGYLMSWLVLHQLRSTSNHLTIERKRAVAVSVMAWAERQGLQADVDDSGGHAIASIELPLENAGPIYLRAELVDHESSYLDVNNFNDGLILPLGRVNGKRYFAILLQNRASSTTSETLSTMQHEVWETGLRALGYPADRAHEMATTYIRDGKKIQFLKDHRRNPGQIHTSGPSASGSSDLAAQDLWTAVDRYITDSLVPVDSILQMAIQASAVGGLPAHEVSPNQGKFLYILAKLLGARKILEIGTLGGVSTIWLARALPSDGRLITLEADPQHAEIARANITRAGLDDIVELRLGKAIETLPQLAAENRGPFDLIFVDADKVNNSGYFEWALKLSRPGTLIIFDNVVRNGAVLDPNSEDQSVQGVRQLNELIAADPRVSATAMQTVGSKGWDGFAMVRVNAVEESAIPAGDIMVKVKTVVEDLVSAIENTSGGTARDMASIPESLPQAEYSEALNLAAHLIAAMNFFTAIFSDVIAGNVFSLPAEIQGRIHGLSGNDLSLEIDKLNREGVEEILKQYSTPQELSAEYQKATRKARDVLRTVKYGWQLFALVVHPVLPNWRGSLHQMVQELLIGHDQRHRGALIHIINTFKKRNDEDPIRSFGDLVNNAA